MTTFSVGDKVKILPVETDSFSFNHTTWKGCDGVITRIDDSDSTAFVEFNNENGNWFQQKGLEIIKPFVAKNSSYCSCDGPEAIVMILFQQVKVCKVCKKEKAV